MVLDLNNELLGKGYNIYLDNWYSSPGLFVQLLQAGTNVCATVRLNRNKMPKDFSKKKRNSNLNVSCLTTREWVGLINLISEPALINA